MSHGRRLLWGSSGLAGSSSGCERAVEGAEGTAVIWLRAPSTPVRFSWAGWGWAWVLRDSAPQPLLRRKGAGLEPAPEPGKASTTPGLKKPVPPTLHSAHRGDPSRACGQGLWCPFPPA